jgi:hypothetical protein
VFVTGYEIIIRSINELMFCLNVVLKWKLENDILHSNPAVKLYNGKLHVSVIGHHS